MLDRATRQRLLLASFAVVPFYSAPVVIAYAIGTLNVSAVEAARFPALLMGTKLAVLLVAPILNGGQTVARYLRTLLCVAAAAILACAVVGSGFDMWRAAAIPIGIASGGLFLFGTQIALESTVKTQAFLMRLAFSLLLAGLLSGAFFLMPPDEVGTGILSLIAAVYLGIAALLPPPTNVAEPQLQAARTSEPFWPLALIFVLFVGQTGFFAFHLAAASANFSADMTPALAAARIGAAVILLASLRRGAVLLSLPMVGFYVAEIGTILAISLTQTVVVLVIAVILYEITLNCLCAQSQGMTGQRAPNRAMRFLSLMVIAGAMTGPVVFGQVSTYLGSEGAIMICCLAIAAPLLLQWPLRKNQAAQSR
ncbi:MAG: hypothetical protein AAGL96_13690 [Pseudomonadota bacterium]